MIRERALKSEEDYATLKPPHLGLLIASVLFIAGVVLFFFFSRFVQKYNWNVIPAIGRIFSKAKRHLTFSFLRTHHSFTDRGCSQDSRSPPKRVSAFIKANGCDRTDRISLNRKRNGIPNDRRSAVAGSRQMFFTNLWKNTGEPAV